MNVVMSLDQVERLRRVIFMVGDDRARSVALWVRGRADERVGAERT